MTTGNDTPMCAECNGTGWYGDNGPGIIGNAEFCRCDCGTGEKCRIGAHDYKVIGGVAWCRTCNREAGLDICRMSHPMPDAPTPEDIEAIERERDELRELYALDTQCLRAERDEARAETEAVKARLQTLRDETFGAAPVSTADENITAIESGITALRLENQALRDALRIRIDKAYRFCPECDALLDMGSDNHYATCRHYATEQAVMQ